MKCLKTLFSSVLLLMVACQFSPVQASHHDSSKKVECETSNKTALPVYLNYIKDISLSYEGTMLVGSIKLDNHLIMRIVDYSVRDDNVLSSWRSGDAVTFKAQVKDEAFVLSVKKLDGNDKEKVVPYVIFDVVKSPQAGLIITEINEEGKFVKLSDDSVWEFSWFNMFSTKHWVVGERVLVYGQGDKNAYEFINLDAPVAKNVSSAMASFVVH